MFGKLFWILEKVLIFSMMLFCVKELFLFFKIYLKENLTFYI